MNERTVEVFNDSLRRCQNNADFISTFYANFISSSLQVQDKFVHTDFKRQNRMLKASLFMVMCACEGSEAAEKYLAQIALRHSRHDLNIEPGLYQHWLNALLQAVQHIDPQFSPEVDSAWREVMQAGIRYMASKY